MAVKRSAVRIIPLFQRIVRASNKSAPAALAARYPYDENEAFVAQDGLPRNFWPERVDPELAAASPIKAHAGEQQRPDDPASDRPSFSSSGHVGTTFHAFTHSILIWIQLSVEVFPYTVINSFFIHYTTSWLSYHARRYFDNQGVVTAVICSLMIALTFLDSSTAHHTKVISYQSKS